MCRVNEALSDYAEAVLSVVERIPAGKVLTYGDVADRIGTGGPRQVGRIMAVYGAAVAWWRVVRADGRLLVGHEERAVRRYRREGTPLRCAVDAQAVRLDMTRARWRPDEEPVGERRLL